jgi:hypothetical protein
MEAIRPTGTGGSPQRDTNDPGHAQDMGGKPAAEEAAERRIAGVEAASEGTESRQHGPDPVRKEAPPGHQAAADGDRKFRAARRALSAW